MDAKKTAGNIGTQGQSTKNTGAMNKTVNNISKVTSFKTGSFVHDAIPSR